MTALTLPDAEQPISRQFLPGSGVSCSLGWRSDETRSADLT